MSANTIISNTGFWESTGQLYHTCSIRLTNWIINYLKDQKEKLTYDFGCGNGQYLAKLRDAGFSNLVGFEGKIPVFKEFEDIRQQDLSVPFKLPQTGNCIFLEVAEHVPAVYEDTLLTNIANACDDKLIMSWAVRGQGGWGHVNCINNDEAIVKVANRGFEYLPEDTASVRDSLSAVDDCHWFKNTTLIFRKRS